MMRLKRFACVALLSVAVVGCESVQENPKTAAGTLVGAGLGALAGSQFGSGKGALAATAVGALAGAWLGSEVGKSLDRADKAHLQRTTHSSLESSPSGMAASWRNPDSGNSGTVMPLNSYKAANGADCRDFETTINVGGRDEKATGRACRQPDGTWRVVQ